MDVALPSGVAFIVIVLVIIGCATYKCAKKKKEEEMEVDDNTVYGVYELGENYERVNSLNEIVDTNVYYE